MKKFLKIFLCLFLILGVIALIVCYIVIPTETQLAFDKVIEYLNTPIFICGISITLGGVLGFFIVRYILNNSSVGKKRLNELKALIEEYKKYEDKANKLNGMRVEKLEIECRYQVGKIYTSLDTLKDALELVPNKKVQEVLNNGKEKEND